VRALDHGSLREEFQLPVHDDIVTSIATHPTRRLAATTAMDGVLRLSDSSPFVAAGQSRLRKQFAVDHGSARTLVQCRWNAEGTALACGGANGAVTVVSLREESARSLRLGVESLCCSVAMTQHGLCAGFQNGTVVLDRSLCSSML
jgi:hypothetical protein